MRCLKCQKLGHIASKCRVKLNNINYVVKTSNGDEDEEDEDQEEDEIETGHVLSDSKS